jgi:hypothetical protein
MFQEESDSNFGPYPVAPAEGSDVGPCVVAGFCMVMGYQAGFAFRQGAADAASIGSLSDVWRVAAGRVVYRE